MRFPQSRRGEPSAGLKEPVHVRLSKIRGPFCRCPYEEILGIPPASEAWGYCIPGSREDIGNGSLGHAASKIEGAPNNYRSLDYSNHTVQNQRCFHETAWKITSEAVRLLFGSVEHHEHLLFESAFRTV